MLSCIYDQLPKEIDIINIIIRFVYKWTFRSGQDLHSKIIFMNPSYLVRFFQFEISGSNPYNIIFIFSKNHPMSLII